MAAQKEILATRMRQLPLLQWLLRMLDAADRHRIEEDVLLAALGLEFPPEEARRHLDLIIEWGRYAELLEYAGGAIIRQPAFAVEPGP